MRTVTITRTIYDVEELKAQCPAAFQAALRTHEAFTYESADTSDEWGSLAALDKVTGYERGRTQYMEQAEWLQFQGRRAWAWLENDVLAQHRIPWRPYVRSEGSEFKPKGPVRTRYEGGSRGYRCGQVPPCPFTGFHMDELLLGSLREHLRADFTVGSALFALEGAVQRSIDEDLTYQASEEGFIEWAEANEVEFYEDGTLVS